MVAKAMSIRVAKHELGDAASFQIVDQAIEAIRKQLSGFEDITSSASTSSKAAAKILERTEIMKSELSKKLVTLCEQIQKLKASAAQD